MKFGGGTHHLVDKVLHWGSLWLEQSLSADLKYSSFCVIRVKQGSLRLFCTLHCFLWSWLWSNEQKNKEEISETENGHFHALVDTQSEQWEDNNILR